MGENQLNIWRIFFFHDNEFMSKWFFTYFPEVFHFKGKTKLDLSTYPVICHYLFVSTIKIFEFFQKIYKPWKEWKCLFYEFKTDSHLLHFSNSNFLFPTLPCTLWPSLAWLLTQSARLRLFSVQLSKNSSNTTPSITNLTFTDHRVCLWASIL